MQVARISAWLPCLGLLLLVNAGCGIQGEEVVIPPKTNGGHDGHDHGDAAHPHEGPHHGSLIELGDEEYHAELVHDEDAGTVTIFVLDAAAKAAVPVEATELVVNLSHDGQATQYKLPATPDALDPAGQSSKFTSADPGLAEALDTEGTQAQLVIQIAGKQYRGTIEHDHDHDAHD